MNVALCLPVYSTFKVGMTLSLIALVAQSNGRQIIYNGKPSQIRLSVAQMSHPLIAKVREGIAAQALEQGADYLLWIDADMVFPLDTLERLAKHDKAIVGANYRQRRGNLPTASRGTFPNLEWVWTTKDSKGLEAVDTIGLGVCLIKAEVFKAMPRPWFMDDPVRAEDGYFCHRAAQAGAKPHIDHDLSLQVGHISESILTF